jgi:hypothetical protein
MAAGGISFQSIDAAKDHYRSAEFILQQWLHKYGHTVANQRLQQLNVIVNTQCAEAFDNTYSESHLFGKPMLADVRSRLNSVAKNDTSAVFQARYEQLLGIASIATEECRLWWSKKFDLENEK